MEVVEEGDLAAAGDDALIPVPSGQPVTLQDVVWNAPGSQGLTLRFRFVAPEIRAGGAVGFDTAVADMQALCVAYALARVTDFGPVPQQVVISMSEKALPFGESSPDTVQFFEAFRIEDGACIWEVY